MLKCHRCHGVFSKKMFREEVNGKTYHAYCAEQVRRPSFNPDRLNISWLWFPTLVFSFFRM